MEIKNKIANEDYYRNELRRYYDGILSGRIMNVNPDSLSTEELLRFISNYNVGETRTNNFCSWVKIGNIGTSYYNGSYYQFIILETGLNSAMSINFSQFIYNMSIDDGSCGFNENEANYVCLIDGNRINPESFFHKNKDKKLLYIYSFPTITSFQTNKTCYYFAFNNITPNDIRGYLKQVRKSILEELINYPIRDIPGTTIITFVNDVPNATIYNGKNVVTNNFALTLFNDEYRSRVENRLKML